MYVEIGRIIGNEQIVLKSGPNPRLGYMTIYVDMRGRGCLQMPYPPHRPSRLRKESMPYHRVCDGFDKLVVPFGGPQRNPPMWGENDM